MSILIVFLIDAADKAGLSTDHVEQAIHLKFRPNFTNPAKAVGKYPGYRVFPRKTRQPVAIHGVFC